MEMFVCKQALSLLTNRTRHLSLEVIRARWEISSSGVLHNDNGRLIQLCLWQSISLKQIFPCFPKRRTVLIWLLVTCLYSQKSWRTLRNIDFIIYHTLRSPWPEVYTASGRSIRAIFWIVETTLDTLYRSRSVLVREILKVFAFYFALYFYEFLLNSFGTNFVYLLVLFLA